MDHQIKILLLIAGIGNGLFLTMSLLRIGQSGRTSNHYLAYLLLAFSLLLITELLDVTLNWLIVPLPIGLLLGPLTYLYVRNTIHSSQYIVRKDIIHALPSILAFTLFFTMFLQNLDNWRFEIFLNYVQPTAILQRISLIGYPMAAILLLIKSKPIIRNEHKIDAKMLVLWLSLFIGIILLLISNSIPTVREIIGEFEQDMMGSVAIVVLVHTLGFLVIARRSLQDGFAKHRATALDDDEVQRISKRIHKLLKTEKQYMDPDFSLDLMANCLKISRNKASDILNIGLGSNFYDVINSYRLDEFKELAALPENKKKSVLELAFACGFNSKTAFYKAFKALEGITPTEYRQNIDHS